MLHSAPASEHVSAYQGFPMLRGPAPDIHGLNNDVPDDPDAMPRCDTTDLLLRSPMPQLAYHTRDAASLEWRRGCEGSASDALEAGTSQLAAERLNQGSTNLPYHFSDTDRLQRTTFPMPQNRPYTAGKANRLSGFPRMVPLYPLRRHRSGTGFMEKRSTFPPPVVALHGSAAPYDV
jgi:hypothetical protein